MDTPASSNIKPSLTNGNITAIIAVIKQNLRTFKKQFEIDISEITTAELPSGFGELLSPDLQKEHMPVLVTRKSEHVLICVVLFEDVNPSEHKAFQEIFAKLYQQSFKQSKLIIPVEHLLHLNSKGDTLNRFVQGLQLLGNTIFWDKDEKKIYVF